MQPSAWFLLGTLLLTGVATAMLCGAIMTDHWERVTWDRARLEAAAARRRNASGGGGGAGGAAAAGGLDWLLDGRVARVMLATPGAGAAGRDGLTPPAVFLVPMHGGIWTLCVTLSEEQVVLLRRVGFGQAQCVNYLAPEMSRGEEGKADWQHRMQNLSISCALVCLIILGAAALVGAFGVLQHQISAVLVTGVMYLLAATFAMFTLTIIHFKRQQTKGKGDLSGGAECISTADVAAMQVDGVSPSAAVLKLPAPLALEADFLAARAFSTGWSLDLGWGGVTLCVLASVLWILLSKIMRYSPLSSLLA